MRVNKFRILVVGALVVMAGCGARNDPFFSGYIKAADRAVEDAQKRGVDKQSPEKFRRLVKLRDDAEKTYLSCDYYGGREMAKQVVARAKELKGLPKAVVKEAPLPQKVSAPRVPSLDHVLFEFDRSTIRPRFFPVLNRAVFLLKGSPGMRMKIEGHADSIGTKSYNKALSEKRAGNVKKYIVDKGVSGGRLSTKGFGEENPLVSNDTEENRAKNRRVVLHPVGTYQGRPIGEN